MAKHTSRNKPCPDLPKGQECPLCGSAYVCTQTWRKRTAVDVLKEKREAAHKQMLRADMFGSQALADANEASERGSPAKAERAYGRGQYWLDRSNALRDKLIEIDAAITKAQGEAS